MRRTTLLGYLTKGRVFYRNQKKYKVTRNLGFAGVVVTSNVTRPVTIQGRTFEARDTAEQVWSSASEVEVEVRPRPVANDEE